MKDEFYAHSRDEKPPEDWHRLEDRLEAVAKLARTFADDFHAGDWGYLAGLWHDLGKYSREFQTRLVALSDIDSHIGTKTGRTDHSTGGAQHAYKKLKEKGRLVDMDEIFNNTQERW